MELLVVSSGVLAIVAVPSLALILICKPLIENWLVLDKQARSMWREIKGKTKAGDFDHCISSTRAIETLMYARYDGAHMKTHFGPSGIGSFLVAHFNHPDLNQSQGEIIAKRVHKMLQNRKLPA